MWVRKQELEALSSTLRQAINGEPVEFRDNQEGTLSLLKNDLHTLVAQLGAERDAANAARLEFAEYMENISHQLKTFRQRPDGQRQDRGGRGHRRRGGDRVCEYVPKGEQIR